MVAAAVVALDQVTKSLALANLEAPIELIDGVLRLRLVYNPGGAFGVLQGVPSFFLISTAVIIVLILLWARNVQSPGWSVPLGLVLGGGVGNLIDRLLRDTDGRVVDFVDLYVWPVFNVADAAISLGVVALLVLSFRAERGRGDEEGDRP